MIEVEGLSLTYRSDEESHLAVDQVSLRVERGQFYTLLGPSGCGKTTTLRCVAGLETPDAGEVRIDGELVSSSATGHWVAPNARGIGMVFQSYAIWPHMSVFDNVAFPLRYGTGHVSAADVAVRVREALDLVQLPGLEDRPAPHLSGGQQQRLALARAFVMRPKVLLLDEPLSNLDAKLREEMRVELRHLVKAMEMTTIFVTHEQIEALTLSDVIAVMKDGRIVQEGTPLEIYQNPTDPFVADFIGQSNLLPGTVTASGADGALLRVDSPVGALLCAARPDLGPGAPVIVAIRPEHVELTADGDGATNALEGVMEATSFIGNAMDCVVRVGERPFRVLLHPDHTPPVGTRVTLHVAARHCLAMADTGKIANAG